MKTPIRLFFLLLATTFIAGCGVGQARLQNDLKQTGLAYHWYHDEHKQGPPGWEAFLSFAEDRELGGDAIRRVKDAGYTIKWNIKFGDVEEGISNAVLADRPEGGPVLMVDGAVKRN